MSFILSKILWPLLAPGNLLVWLLCLGRCPCGRGRRLLRRIGTLATGGLALITVFPADEWLLAPLENHYLPVLPTQVEGILVLGGDGNPRRTELRKQPSSNFSGQRYMVFADLAQRYPQARLAFVGGLGDLLADSKLREADVARAALAGMGVPMARMQFETQSRNTHENAMFAMQLLHPDPQQPWILVTSAMHMPRSIACFRAAGWNVVPYPAGFHTDGDFPLRPNFNLASNLFGLTLAIHEYTGLLAYRFLGYTQALWPE